MHECRCVLRSPSVFRSTEGLTFLHLCVLSTSLGLKMSCSLIKDGGNGGGIFKWFYVTRWEIDNIMSVPKFERKRLLVWKRLKERLLTSRTANHHLPNFLDGTQKWEVFSLISTEASSWRACVCMCVHMCACTHAPCTSEAKTGLSRWCPRLARLRGCHWAGGASVSWRHLVAGMMKAFQRIKVMKESPLWAISWEPHKTVFWLLNCFTIFNLE